MSLRLERYRTGAGGRSETALPAASGSTEKLRLVPSSVPGSDVVAGVGTGRQRLDVDGIRADGSMEKLRRTPDEAEVGILPGTNLEGETRRRRLRPDVPVL